MILFSEKILNIGWLMKIGWMNVACVYTFQLGCIGTYHFSYSEKYCGRRENVMEEMEITAAGLQTVRNL